jgi:hypothetical protein
LTTSTRWKTQQAIYAAGSSYGLKLGAHYNAGVGAYSSIQSTEFYSGTEHPGALVLQPIGGNVGIGVTNPSFPQTVAYNGPTVTNFGLQVHNNYAGSLISVRNMIVFTDANSTQGAIGAYRFDHPNHYLGGLAFMVGSQPSGYYQGAPTSQDLARASLTEAMRINHTGYVGIGTTEPKVPLHVAIAITTNTEANSLPGTINNGSGYYFHPSASMNTWAGTWGANVGIYSRWSIVCGDYIITASDERIKKNIEPVREALDKIRRLDVVSYDRIDYREKGVDVGVVARNVQSVLPKAVAVTKFTIPNIYLKATHVKIRTGVLIEVKCDDKDIKEGSKVKLMIVQGEKEIEHESQMTNWTGSSFEVEEWKEYSEEDKVFAYGVEVDDFLNVDKEQIGILAAGAAKELLTIVEDLTAKSEEQSREISELKRLVRSLLG